MTPTDSSNEGDAGDAGIAEGASLGPLLGRADQVPVEALCMCLAGVIVSAGCALRCENYILPG